jgi:hypothetical protein
MSQQHTHAHDDEKTDRVFFCHRYDNSPPPSRRPWQMLSSSSKKEWSAEKTMRELQRERQKLS